ncbi:MAG TPA: alpha/beta fold hydrolase [Arenimonas sp.]|nr:alpha/beta fold hydrolase [Arenimonas sp.]
MNSKFSQLSSWAALKVGRLTLRIIKWVLVICIAIILGFTLYAVTMLPKLQPWHTDRLHNEFTALGDSDLDFDGYMALETKLFNEMAAEIKKWDHKNEAYVYSRFNSESYIQKLADGAPYNRSFRKSVPNPVGQALLIHGLTDSPYSMKAVAESLLSQGFNITVLRLPGHGTFPSMMVEMSVKDWNAAVRIAAKDVAKRTPANQPFYIVGHSTGGTLALQYILDALDDKSLRQPDRVITFSPAVEITEVADVAAFIDALSIVPIPVLEKVRWQDVLPEYDPYKFNSFPVNATRQVNRASKLLRRSLARAKEKGIIDKLPPIITYQSVVDSTIGTNGATGILYPDLKGAKHHLVLFDVNRKKAFGNMQRPESGALIERLETSPRNYTLEIVSNINPDSPQINITRYAPDNSKTVIETELVWPHDLVSVGHVALPFPGNDSVYGFIPGSGHNGVPSLGSHLLRGENGAISISLGAFTRLRSNPFWPIVDQQLREVVAEDLAVK